MIARYDTPETLFYLDPLYWGGEVDYGKGMFERADYACMAEQLREIEGAFILSINDRSEIREVFAGYEIEEAKVSYSVAREAVAGKAGELILSNKSAVAALI